MAPSDNNYLVTGSPLDFGISKSPIERFLANSRVANKNAAPILPKIKAGGMPAEGDVIIFKDSFNSVKPRALNFAFWSIIGGFISLSVLVIVQPFFTPLAIILMLVGAITGIASSFTSGGRALRYIRNASSSYESGNIPKAITSLSLAYILRPTEAIKSDIQRLKAIIE